MEYRVLSKYPQNSVYIFDVINFTGSIKKKI